MTSERKHALEFIQRCSYYGTLMDMIHTSCAPWFVASLPCSGLTLHSAYTTNFLLIWLPVSLKWCPQTITCQLSFRSYHLCLFQCYSFHHHSWFGLCWCCYLDCYYFLPFLSPPHTLVWPSGASRSTIFAFLDSAFGNINRPSPLPPPSLYSTHCQFVLALKLSLDIQSLQMIMFGILDFVFNTTDLIEREVSPQEFISFGIYNRCIGTYFYLEEIRLHLWSCGYFWYNFILTVFFAFLWTLFLSQNVIHLSIEIILFSAWINVLCSIVSVAEMQFPG